MVAKMSHQISGNPSRIVKNQTFEVYKTSRKTSRKTSKKYFKKIITGLSKLKGLQIYNGKKQISNYCS